MAKQLTIFLENRPGRIQSISKVLCDNAMNVWAFTIQDRGEFGLIKLVVDKPRQAQLVLADAGYACAMKDILAVRADDRPGNLATLTAALLEAGVNIKDAYGFVAPTDRKGLCFLEFENPDKVDLEKTIAAHGFAILDDAQLYEL